MSDLQVAKPRKVRKESMVPLTWVYIVLLLGSAAFAFIVMFNTNNESQSHCTKAASSQLPVATVQSVESAVKAAKMSANETVTLMTAPPVNGWQTRAIATFEPQFCGFNSNITETEVGNQADQANTPGRLVVLRHGQVLANPDGICISNTLPDARLVDGHLQVTINCERFYPSSASFDQNPDLSVQLP